MSRLKLFNVWDPFKEDGIVCQIFAPRKRAFKMCRHRVNVVLLVSPTRSNLQNNRDLLCIEALTKKKFRTSNPINSSKIDLHLYLIRFIAWNFSDEIIPRLKVFNRICDWSLLSLWFQVTSISHRMKSANKWKWNLIRNNGTLTNPISSWSKSFRNPHKNMREVKLPPNTNSLLRKLKITVLLSWIAVLGLISIVFCVIWLLSKIWLI